MTSHSAQGEPGAPNLHRFARIVKARRDALKLTQEEANALGGPSDSTFSKIENRTWRPRGVETLRKLDAGLKWEEGSAERIYFENGDPIPLPDPDRGPSPADPDDRSDFELAVELTVAMEMISRSAWAALQKIPGDQADAIVDQLDATSYLAEKLAFRLADNGEQFIRRRWQVRADVRARNENTALPDHPAHIAEAAGRPIGPDEDWESEPATDDSWSAARADAAREPDA